MVIIVNILASPLRLNQLLVQPMRPLPSKHIPSSLPPMADTLISCAEF